MDSSVVAKFRKELREKHNIVFAQNPEEFADWVTMLEKLEPTVGMEIGTGQGGSSHALMKFLPSLRRLISLDVQKDTGRHSKSLSGVGNCPYPHPEVTYIKGNSALLSTREKAVEVLNGEKLDFLFIDGGHSLINVCADFWGYAPLVRKGGLVGFHDTQTACIHKGKGRYLHTTGEVHEFWLKFSALMEGKVQDIRGRFMGIGVYQV